MSLEPHICTVFIIANKKLPYDIQCDVSLPELAQNVMIKDICGFMISPYVCQDTLLLNQ